MSIVTRAGILLLQALSVVQSVDNNCKCSEFPYGSTFADMDDGMIVQDIAHASYSLHFELKRNLGDIPVDCLALCARFLSDRSDFNHFETTCSRCFAVCNDVLQSDFCSMLFNSTNRHREFKQWSDVRKYAKMIPKLYLNLSTGCTDAYLLHLHHQFHRPMLRGLDLCTKLPFLSLVMLNKEFWGEEALLVCVLNRRVFANVTLYHRKTKHKVVFCGLDFDVPDLLSILAEMPISFRSFERHKQWIISSEPSECEKRCGYDIRCPSPRGLQWVYALVIVIGGVLLVTGLSVMLCVGIR